MAGAGPSPPPALSTVYVAPGAADPSSNRDDESQSVKTAESKDERVWLLKYLAQLLPVLDYFMCFSLKYS